MHSYSNYNELQKNHDRLTYKPHFSKTNKSHLNINSTETVSSTKQIFSIHFFFFEINKNQIIDRLKLFYGSLMFLFFAVVMAHKCYLKSFALFMIRRNCERVIN